MKIEACFLLLLNLVESRGPHHPHGEEPVDQKHHHYRPQKAQSAIADPQLLQDVKHLEEDQEYITVEELQRMSPEELEFYYFSAHDYDGNKKLDGLELLKAVYHTVDHDDDMTLDDKHKHTDLQELVDVIDKTLESDDIDRDGYISYAEYKAARFQHPTTRTSSVLAPAPEVKTV